MAEVNKEKLIWIKRYIGKKYFDILRKLTPEESEFFNKLMENVDLEKSYYVLGTSTMLDKFKAFYLGKCNNIKEVRKHDEFMFSDYTDCLTKDNENDIGVPEILFLRVHSHEIGYGKTEEWLSTVLINNLANRRLKGYLTIILAERVIDFITKSNELGFIDLSKGIVRKKKEDASIISTSSNSEYL